MKFTLMSRAAVAALAAGGVAASGDDKDAGPAPGEGGTDKPADPPAKPDEKPADPPAQPEAEQAVVATADAPALIADTDHTVFDRAYPRMTTAPLGSPPGRERVGPDWVISWGLVQ